MATVEILYKCSVEGKNPELVWWSSAAPEGWTKRTSLSQTRFQLSFPSLEFSADDTLRVIALVDAPELPYKRKVGTACFSIKSLLGTFAGCADFTLPPNTAKNGAITVSIYNKPKSFSFHLRSETSALTQNREYVEAVVNSAVTKLLDPFEALLCFVQLISVSQNFTLLTTSQKQQSSLGISMRCFKPRCLQMIISWWCC